MINERSEFASKPTFVGNTQSSLKKTVDSHLLSTSERRADVMACLCLCCTVDAHTPEYTDGPVINLVVVHSFAMLSSSNSYAGESRTWMHCQ